MKRLDFLKILGLGSIATVMPTDRGDKLVDIIEKLSSEQVSEIIIRTKDRYEFSLSPISLELDIASKMDIQSTFGGTGIINPNIDLNVTGKFSARTLNIRVKNT